MVFNNEEQLRRFILSKSEKALFKATEKVYRIIDNFIKEFYADYDPVMYERTKQLFNSLVKSNVVKTANDVESYVYFDLDRIRYMSGSSPSGRQVMGVAAVGMHGAEDLRMVAGRTGVSIWDDPLERLKGNKEVIKILEQMLISEGIPIKK